MSYRMPDTNDGVNDLVCTLADFTILAPRLLSADSMVSFVAWFEKLETINRRALLIFLRENKGRIPAEYMGFAKGRFAQRI